MAVPMKKVTRAKRGMRRSHDALKNAAYAECDKSRISKKMTLLSRCKIS